MRQGDTRAQMLDQGMNLPTYIRCIEVLYHCIGIALESYRCQSAKQFTSFDIVSDDGRLAKLLEVDPKKRDAAIVLAFEDGWSADEAEAAFVTKPALWTPRKSRPPESKKLAIQADKPSSETTDKTALSGPLNDKSGNENIACLCPPKKKRRSPVLKAEREVELAKVIEVGIFAEKLLQDLQPGQTTIKVGENNVSRRELSRLMHDRDDAIREFVTHNSVKLPFSATPCLFSCSPV